jgi:hypothetical protein
MLSSSQSRFRLERLQLWMFLVDEDAEVLKSVFQCVVQDCSRPAMPVSSFTVGQDCHVKRHLQLTLSCQANIHISITKPQVEFLSVLNDAQGATAHS